MLTSRSLIFFIGLAMASICLFLVNNRFTWSGTAGSLVDKARLSM